MPVTVRYWAGARAAAGTAEERLGAGTLTELLTELAARHGPGLARVLESCSFLLDGEQLRPGGSAPLPDSGVLDVLPPFAGG